MRSTSQIGKDGEQIALDYLLTKGCKLLEKNWRFGRHEIDLIIKDDECVIFVEVKTRRSDHLIAPALTLSKQQQDRIITAADNYIQYCELDCEFRFDIISIVQYVNSFKLKHFTEAFYPTVD